MTNASDDTPRPGEMTEEQLDQFLNAASTDLLGHIMATADPSRTLTAIMNRADQQVPAETPVSTMIRFRDAAHDIARALARDLDNAGGLPLDLDSARALGLNLNALDRDRPLDRALARRSGRNLTRTLDRARALALDLARDLARDLDSALARDLDSARALPLAIARARDLARALGREYDLASIRNLSGSLRNLIQSALGWADELVGMLYETEVNASGADLSALELADMSVLQGVVWTEETTWPAGVREQVRLRSREIRPGVYQVGGGGSEREPSELVIT